MRTSDGQKRCPKCNAALASGGTRNVPKTSQMLTPAQIKLLEFVDHMDGPDRVKALKWVHDVAVYHSEEPLFCEEKESLYQVKLLWQLIEETLEK